VDLGLNKLIMNNKILIVGVLDVPSSTNVFMKKGFEELGYSVDVYNYRTKIKELGHPLNMWTDFINFIYDKTYNLIVFCKVNEMHPDCIDYANRAGHTWYWFMDPNSTAQMMDAGRFAEKATYASATSSAVAKGFKACRGDDRAYHIIEGYDPDIYFYEYLEKIYDVTFIGNRTPKREKILAELTNRSGDVRRHVFGSDWAFITKPVYNEEERRVINQSKIILNLCQDDTIFSDRVVKSLGCGALVLSQYCSDLENAFCEAQYSNEPSLLQLWDSPDSYEHLVNIYKSNAFCEEVRKNTAEEIKENYSWKAVCKRIMEKVK